MTESYRYYSNNIVWTTYRRCSSLRNRTLTLRYRCVPYKRTSGQNADGKVAGATATRGPAGRLLPTVVPPGAHRSECQDGPNRGRVPRHLQSRHEPVRMPLPITACPGCAPTCADTPFPPPLCFFSTTYAAAIRNSAIPGGADRALLAASRLRSYLKLAGMVGGLSAGLYLVYRTFARPGGGWNVGQWLAWLFGSARREL